MLSKIKQLNKTERKQIMMAVMLIGILASSVHLAYAATSGTVQTQSLIGSFLVLAAFLTAGIEWSVAGYAAAWRAHKELVKGGGTDPAWKGFEFGKLKDDLFISAIVGILAFTTSSLTSYVIVDVPSFLVVVQSALGIIVPVDKIVIGAGLNK